MVTVGLIAVVVAGLLLIWWEIRYWGGRITKELVEIGTLLADQLEATGGKK